MAEIQNNSSTKQKGVKRVNKKSTRIDLTPMVDLGFLLITFFVFTTTMAKPKVMDIVVPNDRDPDPTLICESCVITAILDKNDKIYYYEGMPEKNAVLNETTFSSNGIRNILIQKKNKVKRVKGSADDMVLIIKPTDGSVFKNFVDMLDEVNINGIKHYFIDEINVEDKRLLKNSP